MERWICEKCDKRWIFPITKCVYCKGEIKIQKSTQLKVIGFTKVNIPSPMHPIVPYNILILEDEHGNRIPKKTMKEYKIGDSFSDEISKTENSVAVMKIKYDINEAVEDSLALIGDLNVNESSKVLLKPNIETGSYAYLSHNTNPHVVEAVISYLRKKSVKPENITVGENVFAGSFEANAKRSGIANVCRKNNVRLVDLSKTEFVNREKEGYNFEISKELFSHDLIINLPVLKTNVQFGISGSIENMQRTVSRKTHMQLCDKGIEKGMVLLNKVLPKYITIADASNGIQGQGPLHLGEGAFLNLILISWDKVALDRVFIELGMLEIPEYLKIASENGLGKLELKDIEVVGSELDALKYELKKADQPIRVHPHINLYLGKNCNLCLNTAMGLSKLIGINGHNINLVMGNSFDVKQIEGKERIVAFGDQAILKLQQMGVKVIAEINGHPPNNVESLILIKKLLQKENSKLSFVDNLKSKFISKTQQIMGK